MDRGINFMKKSLPYLLLLLCFTILLIAASSVKYVGTFHGNGAGLTNVPGGSGGGFTGNPNQFDVSGSVTNIKSGALITNAALSVTFSLNSLPSFPGLEFTNAGPAIVDLYQSGVTPALGRFSPSAGFLRTIDPLGSVMSLTDAAAVFGATNGTTTIVGTGDTLNLVGGDGGINLFSGTDGVNIQTGVLSGNGSGLTALNASNLASGTVPYARLLSEPTTVYQTGTNLFINAALGKNFYHDLTNNCQIVITNGSVNMQELVVEVKNSGNFSIWATNINFGANLPNIYVSPTADSYSYAGFKYGKVGTIWRYVGQLDGYGNTITPN